MSKFQRCKTNRPEKWRKWRGFLEDMRANGQPASTRDEKRALYSTFCYLRRCVDFADDTYHVSVDYETEHGFTGMEMAHLSIKRHDREPIHDWREMQRIKNAIVGREIEAIELYPAESRVMDTANQYHLYAFLSDETGAAPMFPCGVTVGLKLNDPKMGNAKQRPRNEGDE